MEYKITCLSLREWRHNFEGLITITNGMTFFFSNA